MILIETAIAIALIMSAFLSITLKESIHAVASFGIMMVLLTSLYFALGAPFAAIFQLAIAVGTVAVFFLAGEMLSSKKTSRQTAKVKAAEVIAALAISIPSVTLKITPAVSAVSEGLRFSEVLWRLRGLDLTAQAFVILVISIGASVILRRRRS
ncbi:hypothetical protein CW702_00540 [Candidatus Bathyarchaeota archaeon]|nr:MAG: hypothetical protein CW702_00540 [Candidatus Bathyarchaeota archaeon]